MPHQWRSTTASLKKTKTKTKDFNDSVGGSLDSAFGGKAVGRVTSDGTVYDGVFSGSTVGRVSSDGTIWDGVFAGSIVGRISPPNIKEGGAALLLLLKRT